MPSSSNLPTFVVTDAEGRDVAEAAIDEGVTKMDMTVCHSYLWKYERKEVWLTIFHVDEMQDPFNTVSARRKNHLLGSLQAFMYQHAIRSATMASPSFGKSEAAKADSKLG